MFNFGGGMLTGREIERQIKKGNISISPYDPKQLNPNSYNLKLHPELLIYTRGSDRSDLIPNHQISSNTDILDNNDGTATIINHKDSVISSIYAEKDNLNPLDMNSNNDIIHFMIPESGYVLKPGILYIGRTVERTSSDKFIPMINGRSSGGRLGLSIHVCAGFGDIGFDGTWTLEITVVEPLIIYPNTEIAQVCYFKPCGSTKMLYNGRYNKQIDATSSRFYKSKEEVYK